jgi:hypothetical protein
MLTSGRWTKTNWPRAGPWAAGVGRPTGGRGGPLLGAVCGPGRAARRLPSPAGAEAVLRVAPGGGAGDGISARLASTAGGETGLIAASVTGATGSGTAAGPSVAATADGAANGGEASALEDCVTGGAAARSAAGVGSTVGVAAATGAAAVSGARGRLLIFRSAAGPDTSAVAGAAGDGIAASCVRGGSTLVCGGNPA